MGRQKNLPSAAKLFNPLFPDSPPDTPLSRRVLRVCGWAVLAAAVSAIFVSLALAVGAIAPIATMSVGVFIAKEAALGAFEGLVYAGMAELQGKRTAAAAVASSLRQHVSPHTTVSVHKISAAELEAQIRSIEAQLAAHRQTAEVTR
jgi:hypothetical protein